VTVYVMPCGVSLLDGLIVKKHLGPADCKPMRLVRQAGDLGRAVLGLPDSEVVNWWAQHARPYAADARLTAWEPSVLCAETSTLTAASGRDHPRKLLDDQHRLLVLASDTEQGIAAALYLAQYIAEPELEDVVYLSSRADLTAKPTAPDLRPGTLTVLRIRGLNPIDSESAFKNAVADIGTALRAAFDLGTAMDVHLSGGYKAILLHTLSMTELLYSLDPDRVRAINLFEGTDVVTPIGMRRFDHPYCREMRDELAAVTRGEVHLTGRTFAGLAWTEEPCELNAFGEGFLAVLGGPPATGRPGPGGL
jgi:hypothetical protein